VLELIGNGLETDCEPTCAGRVFGRGGGGGHGQGAPVNPGDRGLQEGAGGPGGIPHGGTPDMAGKRGGLGRSFCLGRAAGVRRGYML
jgi:hypothetical protein